MLEYTRSVGNSDYEYLWFYDMISLDSDPLRNLFSIRSEFMRLLSFLPIAAFILRMNFRTNEYTDVSMGNDVRSEESLRPLLS